MDLVKVDPSTHKITAMPGQTFHTLPAFANNGDCCPNTVAVDGSGRFAYVGGLNDGSIHVYSVDQSSGTWTEISASNSQPSSGGGPVYTVAMHPTNRFLYESQQASSFVNIWSRNQNSGLISPSSGSPFETGALTSSVSVSADGKFLFVPQYESGRVSAYTVNGDGTLTGFAGSPVTAGDAPSRVVADPQDRFFFVLNSGAYNSWSSECAGVYPESSDGSNQRGAEQHVHCLRGQRNTRGRKRKVPLRHWRTDNGVVHRSDDRSADSGEWIAVQDRRGRCVNSSANDRGNSVDLFLRDYQLTIYDANIGDKVRQLEFFAIGGIRKLLLQRAVHERNGNG